MRRGFVTLVLNRFASKKCQIFTCTLRARLTVYIARLNEGTDAEVALDEAADRRRRMASHGVSGVNGVCSR